MGIGGGAFAPFFTTYAESSSILRPSTSQKIVVHALLREQEADVQREAAGSCARSRYRPWEDPSECERVRAGNGCEELPIHSCGDLAESSRWIEVSLVGIKRRPLPLTRGRVAQTLLNGLPPCTPIQRRIRAESIASGVAD